MHGDAPETTSGRAEAYHREVIPRDARTPGSHSMVQECERSTRPPCLALLRVRNGWKAHKRLSEPDRGKASSWSPKGRGAACNPTTIDLACPSIKGKFELMWKVEAAHWFIGSHDNFSPRGDVP